MTNVIARAARLPHRLFTRTISLAAAAADATDTRRTADMKKQRIPTIAGLLCGLALSLLAGHKAHADLHFINSTSKPLYVAIAYLDEEACGTRNQWRVEGWWRVEPGVKATVFNGDLTDVNRYWYYYAEPEGGGGAWSGDYYFPTTSEVFDLCDGASGNGVEYEGFRQIDLGDEDIFTVDDYTVRLVGR
jgi:uncharacterized membrane protein